MCVGLHTCLNKCVFVFLCFVAYTCVGVKCCAGVQYIVCDLISCLL